MRQTLLPIVLSAALSSLLLAACSQDRSPEPAEIDATAPMPEADVAPMPADNMPPSLPEPGEASNAPTSIAADGSDAQARFDGYGDVKLGIAAADMQAAWGGDLKAVGNDANPRCYFLLPAWVGSLTTFNFMIEGDRFVRYSTEDKTMVAPGGGKVGMTIAEVATLYPRIEEQPHKYINGKYLRIKDAASGNALVFETDGAGRVKEWRVGMPPHVDYVEGCS